MNTKTLSILALAAISLGAHAGVKPLTLVIGKSRAAAIKVLGIPISSKPMYGGAIQLFWKIPNALVCQAIENRGTINTITVQGPADALNPVAALKSYGIAVHGQPAVKRIGAQTSTYNWVEGGYYVFLRRSMVEIYYDDLKPFHLPKGTFVYTVILKPGHPPKEGGGGGKGMMPES